MPSAPATWASLAVISASLVLILGPALGRGLVQSYDLVWSPDRRLTAFATGVGVPAPRAVPSEAAAWLVGWLLTPQLAQKVVLVSVLLAAAWGVVALLRYLRPEVGTSGLCIAALAALWNPFVSERLVAGQWTVLLGYAVLPWLVRAVLAFLDGVGTLRPVCAVVAVAAVGGANSLTMTALTLVPLLLAGARGRVRRALAGLAVGALLVVGTSAAWSLPALAAKVSVADRGVGAFAPRSDTPLGVLASLASGGGFWNEATHPAPRETMLIAVLATMGALLAGIAFVRLLRDSGALPMLGAVAVGLLLVTLSVMPATRGLWTGLVTGVPGGGVLRDSQKLVGLWVVALALGAGAGTDVIRRRGSDASRWVGLAAAALVVLLSVQMLWGIGGRLDAQRVPSGYRHAAAVVSGLPDGEVGLLPWSQYRRYDWNADRVSLTLAPRIVGHRVLFDDSLPLRGGTVPGEDRRAARVTTAIAGGASPVEALRQAGVRYLAAETGAGIDVDEVALRAAGRVVVDDDHLLVVDLGAVESAAVDAGAVESAAVDPRWNRAGWLVTGVTGVVVLVVLLWPRMRRKLLVGLLRSPP